MTACRMCGADFVAGDVIVRLETRLVIDDPHGEGYWGSPFDGGLRPVSESGQRQYAHIGCIKTEQERRPNARVIPLDELESEETEPDPEPGG